MIRKKTRPSAIFTHIGWRSKLENKKGDTNLTMVKITATGAASTIDFLRSVFIIVLFVTDTF
jgi:hypothetical protein